MHFIISKRALLNELSAIASIVERKSTIPILSNLLFEVTEHAVTIKGTDLDVSLDTRANADVKQTGAICIPARKLTDIVKSLPDADVEIKADGDQVSLKCERAKFKMIGRPQTDFPEIPSSKEPFLSIPGATLRAFIARTAFAITNEESRFALNSSKLEIKDGKMRMIATDGHRLSFIETAFDAGGQTVDVLVPKKTMLEVAKLAADAEAIEMALADNHIFFRACARLLASRLLTGQFPNYELVLPKENNNRVTLAVADLAAAVRRVALMADGRSHAIKLNLNDGQLSLSAFNIDAGEADETMAVDYNGPQIVTGLNAQYVMDVLNLDLGEKLTLAFKDGNAQMLMTPADGDGEMDSRFILMPMRL